MRKKLNVELQGMISSHQQFQTETLDPQLTTKERLEMKQKTMNIQKEIEERLSTRYSLNMAKPRMSKNIYLEFDVKFSKDKDGEKSKEPPEATLAKLKMKTANTSLERIKNPESKVRQFISLAKKENPSISKMSSKNFLPSKNRT